MSERKQWPGKPSCCMGCEKRHPGCHDVKKCEAWAEHVKKKKERMAARAENKLVERIHYDRRRVI